jgi:hypothetical protein
MTRFRRFPSTPGGLHVCLFSLAGVVSESATPAPWTGAPNGLGKVALLFLTHNIQPRTRYIYRLGTPRTTQRLVSRPVFPRSGSLSINQRRRDNPPTLPALCQRA